MALYRGIDLQSEDHMVVVIDADGVDLFDAVTVLGSVAALDWGGRKADRGLP